VTEIIRLSAKIALADNTLNLIAVPPTVPLDLYDAAMEPDIGFWQIALGLVKLD